MPDGGDVLWPGAGSQAAEIVVEHDVEHPMQAVLDMPVASHRGGEQLGVERSGGQVEAPFEAGATVALDLDLGLGLGLDDGDGARPGKRGSSGNRRSVVSQSTSWLTTWRRTSIRL